MPTVDVREFSRSVVLYFGGDFNSINAYTLASSLVGIADAAKAANAILNPGYEIEVVVEAFASGSFKAKISALYRGADNLFSNSTLKTIVLGVITSFIYQHTLAPDGDVKVQIATDEVVIEQGQTKVVVPREVYEATKQVENSPQFRKGIGQAIRAVDEDKAIESIGFQGDIQIPKPPVEIPKTQFAALPAALDEDVGSARDLEEVTDVMILRAILERSRRRWEFTWNGIRISAPVTDQHFYDLFFAHKIMIAPGDALRVRLRIRQRRDADIGIFINDSYEIVEVIKHVPRPRQEGLGIGDHG
jgi:hypothetical protein